MDPLHIAACNVVVGTICVLILVIQWNSMTFRNRTFTLFLTWLNLFAGLSVAIELGRLT